MSEWTGRFSYDADNVNSQAPLRGGVYRLVYYSNEKFYVFFVGQSNNLRNKLNEHLNSSEQNACIKECLSKYPCFFRYVEVDDSLERDRIEGQQISEFHPSCNPVSGNQ
jgi:hypothetical protein